MNQSKKERRRKTKKKKKAMTKLHVIMSIQWQLVLDSTMHARCISQANQQHFYCESKKERRWKEKKKEKGTAKLRVIMSVQWQLVLAGTMPACCVNHPHPVNVSLKAWGRAFCFYTGYIYTPGANDHRAT